MEKLRLFVCGGCNKIQTRKALEKNGLKVIDYNNIYNELVYKCSCGCVNHTYEEKEEKR